MNKDDRKTLATIREQTYEAYLRCQKDIIADEYERGYVHALDDLYRTVFMTAVRIPKRNDIT